MNELFGKFWNTFLDTLFLKKESVKKLEIMADGREFYKLPEPEEEPPAGITSLFSYKDPLVRELVWQIKYKENRKLISAVSSLLYETILEDLSQKRFFEEETPLLVPIPISRGRLRERGFNQADLICRQITIISNEKIFDYRPDALIKVRETIPQTKTRSRSERLKNLKDVFKVSNPAKISGKIVILIDDVATTGTTIKEAKRTLKNAGARKIYAYTIAH